MEEMVLRALRENPAALEQARGLDPYPVFLMRHGISEVLIASRKDVLATVVTSDEEYAGLGCDLRRDRRPYGTVFLIMSGPGKGEFTWTRVRIVSVE
jgi:hypothetical protein